MCSRARPCSCPRPHPGSEHLAQAGVQSPSRRLLQGKDHPHSSARQGQLLQVLMEKNIFSLPGLPRSWCLLSGTSVRPEEQPSWRRGWRLAAKRGC